MAQAGESIEKLLEVASPPLAAGHAALSQNLWSLGGPQTGALEELLKQRNGFYAFESALHLFPADSARGTLGLEEWNGPSLWRDAYSGMADEGLFFAEDLFGGQFVLRPEGVFTFDPETGELEEIAQDLEGWAAAVLDDYEVLTGHPLAHEWQASRGALQPGHRLVPKIPFVLGGKFEVANLHLLPAVKGMRLRGSIATQIRDLPEGAQVRLETIG